MLPLPPLPIQHLLFILPYLSIACSGLVLLSQVSDNVMGGMLGIQMVGSMGLYLLGLMGNHYVKIYCLLSNLLYMLICAALLIYKAFFTEKDAFNETIWSLCIPQLLILFWFPLIGYIVNSIVSPSISEILHNQLYLGNAAAAATPKLLVDLSITHVLELCDDRKRNDPAKVKAELLQLECSDELGSDLTLMKIAPKAVVFIDDVISKQGSNNKLLIHCTAGVSRSPALVVHWLVSRAKAKSVPDAVRMVRKARPVVDISIDHLDPLTKYHIHGMKSD
jgi:protein-tyrosine phosphatase